MKIALGLSGGVDSAVAAYILKSAGHDVTGVFLDMSGVGSEDARAVAESLGIAFLCVNERAALEARVIAPFCAAYLRGETPNPCILCNPTVKFPALLRIADELGCDKVATGHYARVSQQDGRFKLLRGRHENDQSYMLSGLTQNILSRCVFPLGELNKTQIREKAAELGLFVADKPDSMEICFIPDGDFGSFIESFSGGLPEGDIVNGAGEVLGRHKGLHRYTLGQRRGLGVAAGRRVFVEKLDVEQNRVVLGEGAGLFVSSLTLPRVNWISAAGAAPDTPCTVRVRHSKTETAALLSPLGEGIELKFVSPVRAPTPGQTAAVYSGDEILCAGTI